MIQRIARAVGAAALLAALLVGLPVLLVSFGRSPLDGSGSLWDQLTRFPTQTVSDTVAFGLLTIAAWVSWAVFSLHVVVEVAAALGTTIRLRVPATGLFQMSARRLVTALTMSASLSVSLGQRANTTVPMLATSASTIAVPDPSPNHAAPIIELAVEPLALVEPAADSQAFAPGGLAVPNAAPGAQTPAITVVPGDSPWTLAEHHLGAGPRWRELWDLNRGAPQPDGRSWVTEDLIRPGWRLRLPADAVNVPALPPQPAPADAPEACEPTLPPPDDEQAGLPDSGDDAEAPPTSEQVTPPVAPVPPETTTPASTGSEPTVPSAPTETRQDGPAPEQNETGAGEDDDTGLPAVPLLGVAGTLLAVGVVRELGRRRTRRATVLPVDVVPPPAPHAEVGAELLTRGDIAGGDRLDAALADLAPRLRQGRAGQCAQPRIVQVADDRIDVLLDRPQPGASKPWRAEAAGLVWVLDPDEQPAPTEDVLPLPALVTVGRGEAEILVDLEAHGVVAIVGSDEVGLGLARSIVAELSAHSEGTVAVEIVGDLLDDRSARLDGVRRHTSWDDVDTQTIDMSARLLHAGGWPNTWAARASGRIYDGWAPTVWITRHTDHDRYRQAIDAVSAHPGAGSAMVVVGGDPGCGLRIHLDDHGRYDIPELNLHGEAQTLDADVAGQLVDLLEDADEMPEPGDTGVLVSDDRTIDLDFTAEAPTDGDAATSNGGDYHDPPFEILVRVCGPLRVEGGEDKLSQRETAIVTYVALNGEVDIEQIRDAVWAGGAVALKTVRNVIANTRRSVGDRVAFTPEHRLAAGRGLMTDLELIRRRIAHANQEADPERKARLLRGALEWVTGRVCTYPASGRRCWTWIDLDNWLRHVESVVATAACELAQLYLDLGDGESARWAAARGTEAVGRRDQLTILETRAYELLGDEDSARATIRSHERHLNDLGVEEFNEHLLTLLDRYATPAHHKPAT